MRQRCLGSAASTLVLTAGLLSGCAAPEWTKPIAAPAAVGSAGAAATHSPQERLLERYASTPLGERVRSKRINVVFVAVADTALYDYHAPDGSVMVSSVMRSFTMFKDKSLADIAKYLGAVKAGYDVAIAEIDAVFPFIEKAVEPVDYYRVDLRYELGAEQGAVLVYEFNEGGEDRLLGSRLISAPATLGAIHYSDVDGYHTAVDGTVLAQQYAVKQLGDKLSLVHR